MKYTVALCSYNGADFIEEQLLSILNQTIPPNEIVICDDCSSDATIDLIQKIAIHNPQVSWNIHTNPSNLGYVKNFEKAISISTNELVFLSDQDDVWLDNKAERINQTFEQNPKCSVVFTDAFIVNDQLIRTGQTMFQSVGFSAAEQNDFHAGNYQLCLLLNRSICTGATMTLKKSFFDQIIPFPISNEMIHDAWIATTAAFMGEICFLNEPLVYYRQHEKQSIGANKEQRIALKTKKELLIEHVQRSLNREKLVLEFVHQSTTLQNSKNYLFLQSRVKLLSNLLTDNKSFLKRFAKFTFSSFSLKLPEFDSLRKFAGNWFIYLFKQK